MRIAITIVLLTAQAVIAQPIDQRPLKFVVDGQWRGSGICYGEYRDGQGPDDGAPSEAELREDLHILAPDFAWLRMYGTRSIETVCRIIREDDLPLKVMVGAWIGTEDSPETAAANRSEVVNAIRVANSYPDVVVAINVGNESQVFWSGHKIERAKLIAYLKQAREGTSVPVTTCDDYQFWNRPAESKPVADVCDFIGLHAYAMWNGRLLEDALRWNREQIEAVRNVYPNHPIVHAEGGWATDVADSGEQAELIVGLPGEGQQELYYRAYRHWAEAAQMPFFYFSAFDENWKGGPDPSEVEKHWGLYNADRTPKRAMGGD
ncbi:MAG: glycosyl hydrolase family 17 [Planctomycetota bacterium]